MSVLRISFPSHEFHMNMSLILSATSHGYKFNIILTTHNAITDVLQAWRGTPPPRFSFDTWCSIWMRKSLADGLVVVVARNGHCGHRTSLYFCYMKNIICEVNTQSRVYTSNFQCCKTHECYWYSTYVSSHSIFQIHVAPKPLKTWFSPYVIQTWNGLRNKTM
jgi:hypothetical protein